MYVAWVDWKWCKLWFWLNDIMNYIWRSNVNAHLSVNYVLVYIITWSMGAIEQDKQIGGFWSYKGGFLYQFLFSIVQSFYNQTKEARQRVSYREQFGKLKHYLIIFLQQGQVLSLIQPSKIDCKNTQVFSVMDLRFWVFFLSHFLVCSFVAIY